jgi:cobaltochelatase CobT
MLTRTSLARSLHILGPVLGKKRGVQVRIGGRSACTEGNTIWLPALPIDDAEAAALGFGLLFHETNHLRYTDFTVDRGDGLVGALTNALEDVRVDGLGQEEYRGGRAEEEQLVAMLIRRGEAKACTSGDHPARILEAYVIWRLEYDLLGIEAAQSMSAQAERVFLETFTPELRAKLDARMFQVRNCRSTREVQALARDLAQVLADEARAEAASRAASDLPGMRASPLRQVLDAATEDRARGIGELAQAAVNAKGSEAPALNLPMPRSAPLRADSMAAGAAFALEVTAASNALRQRLAGSLQAESLCRRYPAAAGRHIDMRRIGRVEVGEARIFVRETVGLKTDTAVQLLLDRSGSMGSSRGRERSCPRPIVVAREACYAAALAFQQLPGVAVAAAAFPGCGEGEVAVMADFQQRVERQSGRFASLEAGGGTPLAEAMLWAAGELLGQRNARRILLVVTDGAYDMKLGQAMTARLNGAGIETLGIGIYCDVSHLFLRSRMIATMADLSQALFELLQVAIQRQPFRSVVETRTLT